MRLLGEIRAAQQALVDLADKAPAADAPATAAEPALGAFLAGLRLAWREGEVRPTARPKATKPRGQRRPDPLKDVTTEIEGWFEADPGTTGRQLLERLQAAHTDAYPDKLLWTVQRRLKVWRRERAKALVLGTILRRQRDRGVLRRRAALRRDFARRRRTPPASAQPAFKGRDG